jgi:hypothetical protein
VREAAQAELPRRLEYAFSLLLDRMAHDGEAVRLVLSSLRESVEKEEIGALAALLEDHANRSGSEERERLERDMLDVLTREPYEPRRNGAVHYLLATSTEQPLATATLTFLRTAGSTHPSGVVRAASLWVVARTETAAARDDLFVATLGADPDPIVRETAAEGLTTLTLDPFTPEQELGLLRALEREEDPTVRRRLIRAVGFRGVPERGQAVQALAAIWEKDREIESRREILAALSVLGGSESRAWIERWQSDPVLGEEAALSLEDLLIAAPG